MTGPLRIVLAEDSYLVREGVRQLLEATGDVEVVAAVGTAVELLAAVERLRPDAVLTDIRMPPGHHMEGIDAAREIVTRYGIGVVVLSQHADGAYAHALLSDGAAGLGYLLKERVGQREELVRALHETIAGRSVVDAVVVDALLARQGRLEHSILRRLTAREHDVLALMAQGRTNPVIADSLHLSLSAVEKAINAIFGKLGLDSEAQVHRRVAAVLTFLHESQAIS